MSTTAAVRTHRRRTDLDTRIIEGRTRKAARIAGVLAGMGCDADTAIHLDDEGRRRAEAAADVRPASDETWRIVVEMLAASARARALCTTCGIGAPDGVPGPRKVARHLGPCAR